ncbi:MAG: PKD domain-containing protein [Planctomycetes bacterium]|nr:PKD domain-containing protein [Planctomycetota bacterium]
MKKLVVFAALAVLGIGCGGGDDGPPPGTAPSANFSYNYVDDNPANGKLDIDEEITFTDTSTPGSSAIDTWAWTFAGGSPASSAVQSPPVVTFSTAGFHDVTLMVTNTELLSDTIVIPIAINDPLDVTKPTLDVTSVVIKGTATDNVAVTSLTDDVAAGDISDDGTADEASETFTTHPVTMGAGPGDSTGSVTISADDAANNGPTDVTINITETVVP